MFQRRALGRQSSAVGYLAIATLLLTMVGAQSAAAQVGVTPLVSGQIGSVRGYRSELVWSARGPSSADVWYGDVRSGAVTAVAVGPADEIMPDLGESYVIWVEPQAAASGSTASGSPSGSAGVTSAIGPHPNPRSCWRSQQERGESRI